jgi:RNA-binding protein YlmH
MNQSALLAQAKNEEERVFIKRWINNIMRVDEHNQCITTPFMDPGQQILLEIICQSIQVRFFATGGFKQAERQRLFIYPTSWGDVTENIVSVLRIKTSKFSKSLAHRDYLGSLLGLGLERSVIGDIIVTNDGCYVVVSEEIQDYILQQLVTVGREAVSCEILKTEETQTIVKDEAVNYERTTVPSVRLDAVIASAYKLSRSQAQILIKQGKVKVDHRESTNAAQIIQANMLLSVRGKGRIHIQDIQGETKKGRIGIVVGKIGKESH